MILGDKKCFKFRAKLRSHDQHRNENIIEMPHQVQCQVRLYGQGQKPIHFRSKIKQALYILMSLLFKVSIRI